MMKSKISLFLLASIMMPVMSHSARLPDKMKMDDVQVKRWNLFTRNVYDLHKLQARQYQVRKTSREGGYYRQDNYYTEEKFFDVKSGRLLSRIQWEVKNPKNIHLIEVFIYDNNGKVKLDYLSAYLPDFRNAPIQTLINIHYHDKELHAFRQFDASGDRIYEQCKGAFFGKKVFLSFDEGEIPFGEPDFRDKQMNEVYPQCFGDLATKAGSLLNPLNAARLIGANNPQEKVSAANAD